jgi:hypothetical protein
MREHASNEPETYGRFLNDLTQAQEKLLGIGRLTPALMHPDTGKRLGFDPVLVDRVMAGEVTDHPMLAREEVMPGRYALRVNAT